MTNDEIKVRKNIDNPIRKEQGGKTKGFTCNYTMMRYLGIIILLIALFSACRSDKCTRIFSKDFGLSILPIWEKQTNNPIDLVYDQFKQKKQP